MVKLRIGTEYSKLSFVLVFIVFFAAAGAALDMFYDGVVSVAILSASLMLLLYFFAPAHKVGVVVWYVLSFAVMLAIYFQYIAQYGYDRPYYIGGSDDLMYESYGLEFHSRYSLADYQSLRGGLLPSWHNSPGYVYFVSIVIAMGESLGGYHTLLARVINLFFLSVTGFVVYAIAWRRLQLSRRGSFLAMAAVSLSPIMVYVSSHIYRDIIVACAFVLSVYIITARNLKLIGLIVLLLLIAVVSQMRELTAIFMVLSFLTIRMFYIKNPVVRMVLVGAAVVVAGFVMLQFGVVERLVAHSASYTDYRVGLSTGVAAGIFSIPLPFGLPVRMLYYIVTPVPVFSIDFISFYLSVGTLLQMVCFPVVAIVLIRSMKLFSGSAVAVISWIFLLLWAGLSLTTFTERHMLMFYPLGALILMYGLEKDEFVKRNKGAIFMVSILFVCALLFSYNFMKHII